MGRQGYEDLATGTRCHKRRGEGLSGILLIPALLYSLAVATILFFSAPVSAGTITYDLATDTLSDWTIFGSGIRTGIKLQSANNTLTYSRRDLAIDNNPFRIEAVVSAVDYGVDGERGARFWAWFHDDANPSPEGIYQVDVRMVRVNGSLTVDLFNTAFGLQSASLAVDWANAADRLRIGIERKSVNGQDYLFLDAGPSENPSGPPLSAQVLLSSFASAARGGGDSEVGFGNWAPGIYYSQWESFSITADNLTTSPVPEPSSLLLLGLGLMGVAGIRRKFSN